MAHPENTQKIAEESGQTGRAVADTERADGERRLPFILRVGTTWTNKDDLPCAEDGQLRYWKKAPLTGAVAMTAGGKDVSFSDLEVL